MKWRPETPPQPASGVLGLGDQEQDALAKSITKAMGGGMLDSPFWNPDNKRNTEERVKAELKKKDVGTLMMNKGKNSRSREDFGGGVADKSGPGPHTGTNHTFSKRPHPTMVSHLPRTSLSPDVLLGRIS